MADSDVERNRVMAIIGYIIPIFFFAPFLTEEKNSPFARFHANQQLLILISAVVVKIINWVIFPVGLFFICLVCSFAWLVVVMLLIGRLLWLALVILIILGIINVWRGEMKPLPIIGDFEIIK